MSKLPQEVIEKMREKGRTKCFSCKSTQRYTNPMARCFECKNKFCFKDILGGQINNKMKINDEIRNICKKDKVNFIYTSL